MSSSPFVFLFSDRCSTLDDAVFVRRARDQTKWQFRRRLRLQQSTQRDSLSTYGHHLSPKHILYQNALDRSCRRWWCAAVRARSQCLSFGKQRHSLFCVSAALHGGNHLRRLFTSSWALPVRRFAGALVGDVVAYALMGPRASMSRIASVQVSRKCLGRAHLWEDRKGGFWKELGLLLRGLMLHWDLELACGQSPRTNICGGTRRSLKDHLAGACTSDIF
jgi:hypothetical protein